MKSIEFYINKIKYIEGIQNADISFIPSISRRRLSNLDKITVASLNFCFTNEIQNIIFASKKGEIERLLKIIEQYKTENETSPMLFTGSVHNFAVSSFLINKQISIPYTAIDSGDETLSSGTYTAVMSKYKNNLLVYSDIENEQYVSLCLNISKEKKENSKKCKIKLEENEVISPNTTDFIKFLKGEANILKTKNYRIESANNV